MVDNIRIERQGQNRQQSDPRQHTGQQIDPRLHTGQPPDPSLQSSSRSQAQAQTAVRPQNHPQVQLQSQPRLQSQLTSAQFNSKQLPPVSAAQLKMNGQGQNNQQTQPTQQAQHTPPRTSQQAQTKNPLVQSIAPHQVPHQAPHQLAQHSTKPNIPSQNTPSLPNQPNLPPQPTTPTMQSPPKNKKKSVEDFQFGATIGEGSYSHVYSARDLHTKKTFAIKVLSKKHIVKENKVKYVNIEKTTLYRLGQQHPGIVQLYYTFQDEASLFFVLDFAEYGELLSIIRKFGSLSESVSKFYMCQIIDAVKFIHSKGVIHRDLKPENILVNHNFNLKITDFGAAKLLDDPTAISNTPNDEKINYAEIESQDPESKDRKGSFVGTAEYVSPELLLNNICGFESDVWAIGCVLFQLFHGTPPFQGSTEYLTFEKIIKSEFSYRPTNPIPKDVSQIIDRILVSDPSKRATLPEIMASPWFADVPWDDKNYIWFRKVPRFEPYVFAGNAEPFAYNANNTAAANAALAAPPGFKTGSNRNMKQSSSFQQLHSQIHTSSEFNLIPSVGKKTYQPASKLKKIGQVPQQGQGQQVPQGQQTQQIQQSMPSPKQTPNNAFNRSPQLSQQNQLPPIPQQSQLPPIPQQLPPVPQQSPPQPNQQPKLPYGAQSPSSNQKGQFNSPGFSQQQSPKYTNLRTNTAFAPIQVPAQPAHLNQPVISPQRPVQQLDQQPQRVLHQPEPLASSSQRQTQLPQQQASHTHRPAPVKKHSYGPHHYQTSPVTPTNATHGLPNSSSSFSHSAAALAGAVAAGRDRQAGNTHERSQSTGSNGGLVRSPTFDSNKFDQSRKHTPSRSVDASANGSASSKHGHSDSKNNTPNRVRSPEQVQALENRAQIQIQNQSPPSEHELYNLIRFKEISNLLQPEEKILKMDTILKSQLSNKVLQRPTNEQLDDQVIDTLLSKFKDELQMGNVPVVTVVTNLARVFFIDGSLNVTLIDLKANQGGDYSMYDYEFENEDEDEQDGPLLQFGYLILELIREGGDLIFLKRLSDMDRLTLVDPVRVIDRNGEEIKLGKNFGWIDCLLMAKDMVSKNSPSEVKPPANGTKSGSSSGGRNSPVSTGRGQSSKTKAPATKAPTTKVPTASNTSGKKKIPKRTKSKTETQPAPARKANNFAYAAAAAAHK